MQIILLCRRVAARTSPFQLDQKPTSVNGRHAKSTKYLGRSFRLRSSYSISFTGRRTPCLPTSQNTEQPVYKERKTQCSNIDDDQNFRLRWNRNSHLIGHWPVYPDGENSVNSVTFNLGHAMQMFLRAWLTSLTGAHSSVRPRSPKNVFCLRN